MLDGVTFPNYPTVACCPVHGIVAVDKGFEKRMQKHHDNLAQQIWNNKNTLSDQGKIMAEESLEFINGLHTGFGNSRLEAAWNAPDHLAMSMMEFNLFEFAASKTEARLAAMSQLLIDKEKLNIRSFSDFKREAEKVTKNFNTTYLETEYNLSVAVGNSSANYFRFLEQKNSVTAFVQYQTAGDSQVRDEHALLDGKIFNLDDKEARRLWPPNGYNCRCEMLQYVGASKSKLITGKNGLAILGDSFINSPFAINRAEIKQVFTKNQFYSKSNGLTSNINKLNFTDFGLREYALFKKTLKALKLDHTITAKNAKELFKIDGKHGDKTFMGYQDYLQRKIILPEPVFSKHIKGKYIKAEENRHQLFPHLKDVLESPDEVWLHDHDRNAKTFQVRYLKFYEDEVIVIDTGLGNINLEIKTWYKMKAKEKAIRKGILIQNKKLK